MRIQRVLTRRLGPPARPPRARSPTPGRAEAERKGPRRKSWKNDLVVGGLLLLPFLLPFS